MTRLRFVAAALAAGALAAVPATAALNTTMQAETEAEANAAFNAFLDTYLVERNGIHLVRYGDVTDADHQALKDYVAALEGMTPSTMGRDDQIAYWVNLYNAKTIDLILDAYPTDSIRDVMGGLFNTGPWKKKVLEVEGRSLSLDGIEKGIVLKEFDEPRVHFAFNCASIGCPNLKTEAWEGATLDADLDAAARAFIAHPRGVSVDGDDVTASTIFKWYRDDFGGSEERALDYIRQYASGAKAESLEGVTDIDDYEYDWSLNDAN